MYTYIYIYTYIYVYVFILLLNIIQYDCEKEAGDLNLAETYVIASLAHFNLTN
jgi:hypothetical protein